MARIPRSTALTLGGLLLCGLLCVALLFGAYTEARQEALDNLLAQESILARQAAQSIRERFNQTKSLAWSVAQNSHVVRFDPEGGQFLKTVLRENPHEVLAITRVSTDGAVIFSCPDNAIAGQNISGQEHVARALATRTPVVSDVFTSAQGHRAVALHVPVFKGEVFEGTLGFLLDFNAIAKRHLEPLRVADTGYAFVYSEKGVLLYSPVPGVVGKHYKDVTNGFPELEAAVARMLAGETGTATFRYDHVRERNIGEVLKYASFMPIRLDGTFWSVCVATPESEALGGLKRFAFYLLMVGTMVLAIAAGSVALLQRHMAQGREIALRRESESALRESRERYRSVIENMSDIFFRTDREGRLTMVSPSGAVQLGYDSIEEMQGLGARDFWANGQEFDRMMEMLTRSGAVHDLEVDLVGKDGRIVEVSASSSLYYDEEGNVLGSEGICREIGQRKRDLAALEKSVARFHSLFDNMAEGVALFTLVRDEAGNPVNIRIEEVNRSFEAMFDAPAAQVEGKLFTEAFHTREVRNLEEYAQVAATGRTLQLEANLKALGKRMSISAAPWGPDGLAAIIQDITERKEMEEELRHRALHDPLTGLANRVLCLDRIALAGERARRRPESLYAVVFIDLDRFKIINDSLGHEAGDTLLREIARRLKSCTRGVDTVCRYGGDEFAMVLEDLSRREVLRTLRRIRQSFKVPIDLGDHAIQVEASFGVAYPPAEPIAPEELLRNANIALHRAKHAGRNRVVVYKPSMHEAAVETLSLEHDIRRGLERGEFALFYQPVFHLAGKRLCGFEALLRWRHPLRGLVSPADFVPAAEESGLIFALGDFALERACNELAELHRANPALGALTVSVNLSPRQFARQGLAEQVDRALTDSGLKPEALVLEITESSIMKHPEASANILSRLKARGVGISIDDFGTGYSSLSALQRLPLDILKVDQSFVQRLTERVEDREIVRAVVTLASSLHLRTVAEGIETEEQLQALLTLGCEMGQGYLCARPMPMEDAVREINADVCQRPEFQQL